MKKVLLIVAALFACNTMFAQLTEKYGDTPESKASGSNAPITGISYTIAGTYDAGASGNGFKMRTGSDGNRCVFTVNNPYIVTAIELDGKANYAANDAEQPCIVVTKVEVDGVEIDSWEGGKFPQKSASETAKLTISNIRATESIAIYFDNSNASGNQVVATYTVTYEEPAAAEPKITLSPDTVHLVPGASYQITSKILPGTFADQCIWYAGSIEAFMDNGGVSPENDVVELGENGLITAKGAGEIPVKLTWIENPGVNEDTTIVIVNNFFAQEHQIAQSYDFTAMGDVELAIGGDSYLIWNAGNKQCNGAQFCTNEGLENLAFQSVVNSSNSKGYKIVDGQGLVSASAGRCGAVGNLKKGQYIEFIYTGTLFESKDYTMDLKLGPDAGTAKTIIDEEVGRRIYQVMDKDGETENLMVGFEISSGQYIKSITVYEEAADPTAIQELETVSTKKSATIYNLMGMKVAAGAKGLLIKDGKKFVIK